MKKRTNIVNIRGEAEPILNTEIKVELDFGKNKYDITLSDRAMEEINELIFDFILGDLTSIIPSAELYE